MEDTYNEQQQHQEHNTEAAEQQPTSLQQPEQQEQQQQEQHQSIAEKQQQQKSKEENFRRLQEKFETEKKQLSDKVNQLEQQLRSQQGLSDDDLVEGRHVMSLKKDIEQMQKQMQESQQKMQETQEEDRLKNQYQDLYSVVKQENLEKLKQVDPVAYDTIMSASSLYNRGHMAYQAIKKWGIADASENDKRIEENQKKPQVGQSPGALSNTEQYRNYMTKEERAEKWKEVQRYMRGI